MAEQMADTPMPTGMRCPLCGLPPGADGTCPDCGQDLTPLIHLAERPDVLYNRALELAAAGDNDGARRLLETALAERPSLVDAWVVLGKLRARSGDLDGAERAFAEALRRDGSHAGARLALAASHARATDARSATRSRRRRRWALLTALGVAVAVVAALLGSALTPRAVGVPQATEGPGFVGIAGHDGTVELTGVVPDDATHSRILAAAQAGTGVRAVADMLVVDPTVITPQGLAENEIGTLAGALANGPGGRTLLVGADRLVVSGTVTDQAARQQLVDAVGHAVPGRRVEDRLALGAVDDDTTRLNAACAAVQSVAPIRFLPGKSTLGGGAMATVTAVAGLLKQADGIRVEVDGYAATAPGQHTIAQSISDQRAQAVAHALVAAGVKPELITARGLADGVPQAGRRADIKVLSA